jgi:hypothetical protein
LLEKRKMNNDFVSGKDLAKNNQISHHHCDQVNLFPLGRVRSFSSNKESIDERSPSGGDPMNFIDPTMNPPIYLRAANTSQHNFSESCLTSRTEPEPEPEPDSKPEENTLSPESYNNSFQAPSYFYHSTTSQPFDCEHENGSDKQRSAQRSHTYYQSDLNNSYNLDRSSSRTEGSIAEYSYGFSGDNCPFSYTTETNHRESDVRKDGGTFTTTSPRKVANDDATKFQQYPNNNYLFPQFERDQICIENGRAGNSYSVHLNDYNKLPKYDKRQIYHQGTYHENVKNQFPESTANQTEVMPRKRARSRRNKNEPRRALSAYNIFFSEERERILALLPERTELQANNECGEQNPISAAKINAGKIDKEKERNDFKSNKAQDRNDEIDEEYAKNSLEDLMTDKAVDQMDLEELQKFLATQEQKMSETEKVELEKKIKANTQALLAIRTEGDKIKKSHKKKHGKIKLIVLSKIVGRRWRNVVKSCDEKKDYYYRLAKADQQRYQQQMGELWRHGTSNWE